MNQIAADCSFSLMENLQKEKVMTILFVVFLLHFLHHFIVQLGRPIADNVLYFFVLQSMSSFQFSIIYTPNKKGDPDDTRIYTGKKDTLLLHI